MRIVVLVLVLILCGCVSVLPPTDIPVQLTEFGQPLEKIKEQYSGIEKFEKKEFGFEWFSGQKFGDIAELEKIWGKPSDIESNWGRYSVGLALNAGLVAADIITMPVFGIVFLMFACPMQTYHWYKGDIHIEAIVRRNGFSGYSPFMVYWKWSEVSNKI